MIGVVLAGGLATRLPNKALLPLKNGKPAVTSSIDMLQRSHMNSIVLVVPPASVFNDVLQRDYPDLCYVEQEEAVGVPSAIRAAAGAVEPEEVLYITCCDNVWPDDWLIAPDPDRDRHKAYQQVQRCPSWKAMHLSRYAGHWTRRSTMGSCVAGVLIVPATTVVDTVSLDMISFLDEINALPWGCDVDGWWDIGVADTYRRYWHERTAPNEER